MRNPTNSHRINRKLSFLFFICCFLLLGCGSDSGPPADVVEPLPSPPLIAVGSSFDVTQTGSLTITPTVSVGDTATISDIVWTVLDNNTIELVEGEAGAVSLTAPAVSQDTSFQLEIKVLDSFGQETTQWVDVTILEGMYASSDVSVTLDFPADIWNFFFGNFNASPEMEVIVARAEDDYNGLEVYSFDKNQGLTHAASINTGSLKSFSQVDNSETGTAMLLASEDFYASTVYSVVENVGENAQITPIDFDNFSSLPLSVLQSSVTGEGIELQIAIPYPGVYGYDEVCILEKITEGYQCIPQNIFNTQELDELWETVERFSLIDLDRDGRQEMLVNSYRYTEDNGDFPYEPYIAIYEQTSDYEFTFSFELDNDAEYRLFEDFNGDGLLDYLVRKGNQLFIAEQIEGQPISFSSYIDVDGSLCHQDRSIYIGSLNGGDTTHFICRVRETISVRKESGRYIFEKLDLPDDIDEVRDVLDVNGDQIMDMQARRGEEVFFYLGNGTGFEYSPAFFSYNIRTGSDSQYDIDLDGDLDALKLKIGENQSKIVIKLNMLRNLN